jgi:hypothetical protein
VVEHPAAAVLVHAPVAAGSLVIRAALELAVMQAASISSLVLVLLAAVAAAATMAAAAVHGPAAAAVPISLVWAAFQG